jgi:hypothetical protein
MLDAGLLPHQEVRYAVATAARVADDITRLHRPWPEYRFNGGYDLINGRHGSDLFSGREAF